MLLNERTARQMVYIGPPNTLQRRHTRRRPLRHLSRSPLALLLWCCRSFVLFYIHSSSSYVLGRYIIVRVFVSEFRLLLPRRMSRRSAGVCILYLCVEFCRPLKIPRPRRVTTTFHRACLSWGGSRYNNRKWVVT